MNKLYKKKNGAIYYGLTPITGADYNSFTGLEGVWATDKNLLLVKLLLAKRSLSPKREFF